MGGRVIDLTLPRLGETMEQGRIVAWLKKPGDAIRRGETVLEVETDKTVVEVPALEDGVLAETLVAAGDVVDVDAPIGRLAVAGAPAPAAGQGATVVDFLLPRLGETMEEGRVVAWLKAPGERFRRGETILEVETDKTVVEVPALEDGRLVDVLVQPDGRVAVDRPVARIAVVRTGSPKPATAPAPPGEEGRADRSARAVARPVERRDAEPLRASPVARRLAREAGIDLATVAGTGRRGRVSGDDVRAALASRAPGGAADRVTTRHGDLAVRRFAAGRRGAPVVLLHGLFGDADTFADLARRIGLRGRGVIALDLPGHGRSGSVVSDPDAVVDAVEEAVRALVPGPVRLVGHSWGGAVATRVAARMGRAVERLVLLSPAGFGRELDQGFVDAMLSARTPDALRTALARLGADTGVLSETFIADQVELLSRRSDVLAAIAATVVRGGVQQIDATADAAAVDAPISAVFGLADAIVPWSHATALPARAAVHFVRDAGHMPHWAAADLVAELVDADGTA
jgi:pyruvate dehydrogenase E2 component (dihydrolipoamide acetyltransferase)